MKITYRIPTKEPFAFVELTQETDKEAEISLIRDTYDGLTKAFKDGEGLSDKDFNAVLDEYLSTGTVVDGTELYAEMNAEQQGILQAIKRSFKRINK